MTTHNATDLLVSANTVQTETADAGAGFTMRLLTCPDVDIAEDRVVTTAWLLRPQTDAGTVGVCPRQLYGAPNAENDDYVGLSGRSPHQYGHGEL